MSEDNSKKKMFKILSPQKKKDGTTWWMKCGIGYENKDNSVNMFLESLPLDRPEGPLKLQLREYTDAEIRENRERAEQRRAGGGGGYASRGGGHDSGGYASRGTLGSSRSSTFDTHLDPSHVPLIPGGGGGDAASLDQTPF